MLGVIISIIVNMLTAMNATRLGEVTQFVGSVCTILQICSNLTCNFLT